MTALLAGSIALVAYVFAGYPALMAALAHLRPKPLASDPRFEPSATLVICAHNEQDVIEAKLRNVGELDYAPDRLETIVVADGSDDDTAARAAAVPGVSVLHDPRRAG